VAENVRIDGEKLQVDCPECGQTNAVPLEKILHGPVCGSCQVKLPPPNRPIEVTDQTFDDLVRKSPLPVLVDFWAPWCGPCRMMGPTLESFAGKKAGQVLVAKLNTDESPATQNRFGVQGIPTLIVFKNGRETSRQVGAVSEQVLEGLLPP
jgi:thioredoxin 2